MKQAIRPRSKEELRDLIWAEMKQSGNQCDLNHISVSLITNFSDLFYGSEFNGNISKWNVSGVENMGYMFQNSEFSGDLSNWDVSSVASMEGMFCRSKFEGDISYWNTTSLSNERYMFFDSKIAKSLGIENPSFDEVKSHFLNLKLEADLKDALPGQNQVFKVRL